VASVNALGHRATIDFMGESARNFATVDAACKEFLRLVPLVARASNSNSISLDLSHIGSVLDPELGSKNARRIASVAHAHGIELILSMEGPDRVDQILEDHRRLSAEFDNVGVTIQARMYRTRDDIPALLERDGRIRLVKGAYDTASSLAAEPESSETAGLFDEFARTLLLSGHRCSIATHDEARIDAALATVAEGAVAKDSYYVEHLSGLADLQLLRLQSAGVPTQEYIVYGEESWLYVCNRLAEDPWRAIVALGDAARAALNA